MAEFRDEKEAFGFQAFLQQEKIQSLYDVATSDNQNIYRLWVIDEDDFDKAYLLYVEWQKNPQEIKTPPSGMIPPAPSASSRPPRWKIRVEIPHPSSAFTLNNLLIFVCILVFFWNSVQDVRMADKKGVIAIEDTHTPLERKLLFDDPIYFTYLEQFFDLYPVRTPEELAELSAEGQECFNKIKNAPTWKGVADMAVTHNWGSYDQLPPGTLFKNIRQGQVWRLITPVLLHGSLLHILFNMLWLFLLGRLVEPRLGALRYLLLSLIIGVVSNVAQYLVSGPDFVGYSGIIVGLVGFIWMRQKIAPWEGYPLHRSVVFFILIFVAVMLGLELAMMTLQYFHATQLSASIANTAHIIGGVTGILLARLPFFRRSPQ